MKKDYCVYKHTAPNGKVYIGITCQNPLIRWANGLGYSRNGYFTNAIVKYGWDNIKHEILFDGLTKEDACQKEIELIAHYKSNIADFGYNLSSGGENGAEGVTHFVGKVIDGFEVIGTGKKGLIVQCTNCGKIYDKHYPTQKSNYKCECMKAKPKQPRHYVLITYKGKTQNATEWAKETGINADVIRRRYSDGKAIDEIFAPVREQHKREIINCNYCGREFFPKWTGNKFCSPECCANAQKTRTLQYCVVCGKEFLGKSYRKSKYCSLECYKKDWHNAHKKGVSIC